MRFIRIAVIAVASLVPLTRGSEIPSDLIQAVCRGNIETVQYLIERKVNLNESDTTGSTALLRAIMSRHEAIADLLIGSGANVNQVNDEGLSPLRITSKFGLFDLSKFLKYRGG